MSPQPNRLTMLVLLMVAIAAVIGLILVFRKWNASPYSEITPQRAHEARRRIEEAEMKGPPGIGSPRR